MKLTPLEPWIARQVARQVARPVANKTGPSNAPLARSDLERYQIEKLRETIELARTKSPFYRKHFAGAPQTLATRNDLAQFPFTTAQALRDHPLQLLCTSQDDIHRVVTLDTSGTTGEPKRIYFTQDDQELTIDFFHIGMSTFTAPGDCVLILLPCERPGSVGDLLASGLERMTVRAIQYGPGHAEAETLQLIARENVSGIVGTPTQALALARQPDAPALQIKSVLLSTDHVPHAIVDAIERAWGCTVYNHYGMTEMGLGGGVECAARRGYHLREADLYFEIVNPLTGLPVAEGQAGEVVFTTLTRRGMPLIRYRTGDLGHFISGECPCGTTLKTLSRITTRRDGFVRVGDSFLTMADLDEAIFAVDGVVNFAATLLSHSPRARLEIAARVIPGYETNAAAIQAAVESIPAVGRAAVAVEVSTHLPARAPQAGKRRINCL